MTDDDEIRRKRLGYSYVNKHSKLKDLKETFSFQQARWKVLTEYLGHLADILEGSHPSYSSKAKLARSRGYSKFILTKLQDKPKRIKGIHK